jgi:predicted PurR-regulated permease PerM
VPTQAHANEQPWQRAIILLTGTLISLIVVAGLYWVQVVCIPLVLAVLLTFILGPFVRILQRRGVPRVPAVVVVMLVAGAFIGGMCWLITWQTKGLLEELPNYEANIKKKIDFIKEMGPANGRFERLTHDLRQQWRGTAPADEPNTAQAPTRVSEISPVDGIAPIGSSWLSSLPHLVGSGLAALGGLAFVLTLTVFMLLKREDLRSRFLRLAGRDHLTMTTKAVDEAFQRISRFLVAQLLLNGAYGLILALGLALMGIQHAILWGVMAAVMRYVPYIGAWVVGALLIALSLAISAGWALPLMVMSLFLALEITASVFAEPLVYGKSIGVSQVALLVAAAFWAFLWGPIGLVLSGPMTVCLVVLGKYVDQLKFMDVLLGDEPALAPDVGFYQRLLAQDRQEAIELALAQAKTAPREAIYDSLLLPALTYAKRDRDRDQLDDNDEQFIHRVIREILEQIDQLGGPETSSEPQSNPQGKCRIVACAGQDESDALAIEMFCRVLDPAFWEVDGLSNEMLTSEIVAHARDTSPAVVCIAALPPGRLSHTRYLCKRLRAEAPHAKIVVGRWGQRGHIDYNLEELKSVGVDDVESTLLDTRDWLKAHMCVLAEPASSPLRSEQLVEAAT